MAKVPYVVSLQGSISKTCFILFYFFAKHVLIIDLKDETKLKSRKMHFSQRTYINFMQDLKPECPKLYFYAVQI